jgi:hypothetical protein
VLQQAAEQRLAGPLVRLAEALMSAEMSRAISATSVADVAIVPVQDHVT